MNNVYTMYVQYMLPTVYTVDGAGSGLEPWTPSCRVSAMTELAESSGSLSNNQVQHTRHFILYLYNIKSNV